MKRSYILPGLALCFLAACKPDLKSDAPNANGVDFSNYVAVGNSLTAGYADNSLYRTGQMNSYPAILAEQLKLVGGGEFKQPLLPGDAGYPSRKLVLGFTTDCLGQVGLSPVPFSGTSDSSGSNANISAEGPFNNLGVPGIRAIDYLFPGYATVNPYAHRFYSNLFGRPLDEAKLTNPTFFSIWLGSNDVLGYALSGGEGNPAPIHTSNISDYNTFAAAYDSVVQTMTKNGAKGVLINIPDVTSIPFFTTIPSQGKLIEDLTLASKRRLAEEGELILLTTPQDSLKCGGWGSATRPIPKSFVLTHDEIDNIRNATMKFNNFIHDEAVKYGLGYVDMNQYLKTVAAGIKFNGVHFTTEFVSGGAFSLDAVHLTPRGYALVANEILRVVNAYYKTSIPSIDVNKYSGLRIP